MYPMCLWWPAGNTHEWHVLSLDEASGATWSVAMICCVKQGGCCLFFHAHVVGVALAEVAPKREVYLCATALMDPTSFVKMVFSTPQLLLSSVVRSLTAVIYI